MSSPRIILIMLVMLPVCSRFAQGQEPTAEQRLRRLIDVINTGDSASIAAFAATSYAASHLAESGGVARAVRRWREVHETYGRLQIDSILTSDTASARAWVRGTISRAWLDFRVVTQDSGPRQIVRVGLGRGLRPDYVAQRMRRVSAARLPALLRQYLSMLTTHDLFSGVVLVGKGDDIIFENGYGNADRDRAIRNGSATRFDIASVGKMFTAVAVAQLAEQGTLSFTDTLAKHRLAIPDAIAKRITIAQLLSHTSGLGEMGAALDSAMMLASDVAQMVALLADTTLQFAPGTNVAYSNRGYLILGALIEAVSDTSYFDYVQAHVFAPAGMTQSGFFRYDAPVANVAKRYSRYATVRSAYAPGPRFVTAARHDVRGSPAGGAFVTARDLFRFGRAFEKNRLVSAATHQLLTTPVHNVPWGLGFEVGAKGAYGHRGAAPGATAYFYYFPATDHTLVVLSNYDAAAHIVADYIRELLESLG